MAGRITRPTTLPISKYCKCGFVVSKIRSWTKDNPGRRFVACPDYDNDTGARGCSYFRWVDEENPTQWQTDVILNLVADKERLAHEVATLKNNIVYANCSARRAETRYVLLKMKNTTDVFGCGGWVLAGAVVFMAVLLLMRMLSS